MLDTFQVKARSMLYNITEALLLNMRLNAIIVGITKEIKALLFMKKVYIY